MRAQPVGVAWSCNAKYHRLAEDQQLHDKAADSARSCRNGDGLTGLGRDRADSRVRRHTDDVQRAGHLPTQMGRFADQLTHRHGGVGGVAGPAEAEPKDLVADGELADLGSYRGHDAGKVATLAGRKRGGEHVMQRPDSDGGLPGVDPGRTNLDHHLAPAGRRHIDVDHIQHLTAPVTVELYGARHRSRHLELLTPIEAYALAPRQHRRPTAAQRRAY